MTDARNPHLSDHQIDQILDQMLGEPQARADQSITGNQHADEYISEMESAAALLDIAVATANPVEMPADLAERITASIDQYPSNQQRSEPAAPSLTAQSTAPAEDHLSADRGPIPFPTQSTESQPRTQWVPWIAAAACLLIASVAVLLPRGVTPITNISADREALIASTAPQDLIQWDWISTDDQAVVGDVIGDVVWSDSLNKGYMRISGLALNDPSLEQYQLWIFDATRPTDALPQFGEGLLTQRPIDGGVFDVNANGEVIIEIDAKLNVQQAAAFAVTVEPPGGVVVSDRSRVPLLALAPS